jgi:hypothetical protein
MTPRPDEYTLVCLDCDPEWPDSDLTRADSDPPSTAVHPFPTVADRETWATEHQRATGHGAFWRTKRVTTRADRVREMGVRYVQVCVECHPEYAPDVMPLLDPVLLLDPAGSPAVQIMDSATDCIVAAYAHHEFHSPAGHSRFRTELVGER